MEKEMLVKCNNCDWKGGESKLVVINDIEFCPMCKEQSKGKIMDLHELTTK